MALNLQKPLSIFIFVYLVSSLFVHYSWCLSPDFLNETNHHAGGHHTGGHFKPALGTWYGDPNGAGSGGACGWADDVKLPPFSAMIAAGNANIFLKGKGCGNCYQLKCTRKPYCSGKPITVTITDECPGACNNVPFHFDLSGTAFGAMANPGQAHNLRMLGQVEIAYKRVRCHYGHTKIAFKIDAYTNPYWFATAIEFDDGDGGLSSVEVAPAGSNKFVSMQNIWGAVWIANVDPSFKGPYSFRLKAPTNQEVEARDAVPFNFAPGKTYYSHVNFGR